jgi:hypothetical protein
MKFSLLFLKPSKKTLKTQIIYTKKPARGVLPALNPPNYRRLVVLTGFPRRKNRGLRAVEATILRFCLVILGFWAHPRANLPAGQDSARTGLCGAALSLRPRRSAPWLNPSNPLRVPKSGIHARFWHRSLP